MKPASPGPLKKFHIIHSDTKQTLYTLWFRCKRLARKMKGVLGASKAGSVRLPQEIVDRILDYISDDRRTLFACTHLSFTWCIAARAHLHRTFTVLDPAGLEAVNDLQSMGMVHLVRGIAVAQWIHQTDFVSPGTRMHLSTFTHVQELEIGYLNVGGLLTLLHQHCDVLKSTVRTLTLRYPRGSTEQLLCFISLFSDPENLAVECIESGLAPAAVVPILESSPPLTGRLALTGIFDQEFMSGLASLQNGLKFRTVDLQFCEEAQEIIDNCAGTMERFIWHPSEFRDTENLDLSRCDSLRYIEVSSRSIIRASPDHLFRDFVSAIPSHQLKTCLIMSRDDDLDELKQVLLATPKPEGRSTLQKEKEKTKRDVKITFGLDAEEEADDHYATLRTALDCAIRNGVFEFLTSAPVLEVHPRVWDPTA